MSGAGSRLGLAAGREREGRPASFPPAVPPPRPREAAPGRAPPAGGGSRGAASIVLRRSSGAPPRGGGSAARGLTGPGPSRRAGAALWANKARRPAPAASAALPGAEGPRWLRARRPVRAWRRRRCRGGSRGAGGAGFCRCPSRLYVPSSCFPSVCALISRCLLFSPFSSLLYFFGLFFSSPLLFRVWFPFLFVFFPLYYRDSGPCHVDSHLPIGSRCQIAFLCCWPLSAPPCSSGRAVGTAPLAATGLCCPSCTERCALLEVPFFRGNFSVLLVVFFFPSLSLNTCTLPSPIPGQFGAISYITIAERSTSLFHSTTDAICPVAVHRALHPLLCTRFQMIGVSIPIHTAVVPALFPTAATLGAAFSQG